MIPFFFFNYTATTEIYTLSLHDALPISLCTSPKLQPSPSLPVKPFFSCSPSISPPIYPPIRSFRSEEHTSELQSQSNLVCRLLLEKKNNTTNSRYSTHYVTC